MAARPRFATAASAGCEFAWACPAARTGLGRPGPGPGEWPASVGSAGAFWSAFPGGAVDGWRGGSARRAGPVWDVGRPAREARMFSA